MTPKQKKAKKAKLIALFGPCCWHCKHRFPAESLTLDHLIPRSKGGSNSLENLWLACFPCNNSRGNSFHPPRRSFGI
ncbi:MAG: HNH endonuclease [Leptolyngbya sp. BL-A-14]